MASASITVGSIQIEFAANFAKFISESTKATTQIGRMVSGVSKKVSGFVSGTAKALTSLPMLLVGAGAAFGGSKLASMFKQTADDADLLGKAAKRLGVGVEPLSALKFAAAEANVEFEGLAKMLGKAEKNLAEMVADGKVSAQVGALSVRLTDTGGEVRSITELLPELARGIESAGSEAEQLRLSEQIFGREGGQGFVDLLKDSGDFMENLATQTERAKRLGAIVTQDEVDKLTEANDAIDRVGVAWEGVKRKIAVQVAPAVTRLANQTATLLASVPEMFSNAMKVFDDGDAGAEARDHLRNIGRAIKDTLYDAVVGGFLAAWDTVETYVSARLQVIMEKGWGFLSMSMRDFKARVDAVIKESDPDFGNRFAQWKSRLGKDVDFAISEFDKLTDASGVVKRRSMNIPESALGTVDKIKAKLTELQKTAMEFGTSASNAIAGWSSSVSDAFADLVIDGKASFGDLARSWAKTLLSMAQQKFVFDNQFKGLGSWFGGLFSPSGGGGGGGSSPEAGSIAQQYGYAHGAAVQFGRGGVVTRPTSFDLATGMIGERGRAEGYFPLVNVGGDLGVRGVAPEVYVQLIDQRSSGARPEVSQGRGPDGRKKISVLLRDEMKAAIGDGSLDRALATGYGLTRAGTRR